MRLCGTCPGKRRLVEHKKDAGVCGLATRGRVSCRFAGSNRIHLWLVQSGCPRVRGPTQPALLQSTQGDEKQPQTLPGSQQLRLITGPFLPSSSRVLPARRRLHWSAKLVSSTGEGEGWDRILSLSIT